MSQDRKIKLLPRWPRRGSGSLYPIGVVGQAQNSPPPCHCGKPAFYLVPGAGKLAGTFIGFCGEHKEDANDAGRLNGRVSQQHREQSKDRTFHNRNREAPNLAKHKEHTYAPAGGLSRSRKS